MTQISVSEKGMLPVVAACPLRYLVNCAIALGVDLDEVIEEEWHEWHPFSALRRFWEPHQAPRPSSGSVVG
ncbi:MAG TPA: hypothetical protein VNP93_08095 [Gaiellaceae bacterium]|nr:hypothetical protein [Gaiellaceae bacterium]